MLHLVAVELQADSWYVVDNCRAMDFLTQLLGNLRSNPECSMVQCAQSAYAATLKPYHGWIAAAAFSVRFNHMQTKKGVCMVPTLFGPTFAVGAESLPRPRLVHGKAGSR